MRSKVCVGDLSLVILESSGFDFVFQVGSSSLEY